MPHAPWHVRVPNALDLQQYDHLATLHRLTLSWLAAGEGAEEHTLKRADLDEKLPIGDPQLVESLARLGSGAILDPEGLEKALDESLDDTSPQDLLLRLESTVLQTQTGMLAQLLGKAKRGESEPLMNQLQQSSWKAGRDFTAARWARWPELGRCSLSTLLAIFKDTPFSAVPSGYADSFLIKRCVASELELELRHCPHDWTPAAPELCELHAHWLQGFTYVLNPSTTLVHLPRTKTQRCRLRWTPGT